MTTYGEVLDYRTSDKAVVGKKYIFGDSLRNIQEISEEYKIEELSEIHEQHELPFVACDGYSYQFCREVIEEKPRLMTNRQLAEWLERKNGEYSLTDSCYVFHHWTYGKGDEKEPVQTNLRIRSWGSEEWVVPTVEIYEWDCKYEKNCKEASK